MLRFEKSQTQIINVYMKEKRWQYTTLLDIISNSKSSGGHISPFHWHILVLVPKNPHNNT